VLAHAATCSSQTLRTSWQLRFDRSTRKNSILVPDSGYERKEYKLAKCSERNSGAPGAIGKPIRIAGLDSATK